MDKAELIRRRRGRLIAQVFETYESDVEPNLPPEVAEAFKQYLRRKIDLFTTDITEIVELKDTEVNGHAIAMRDSLSADSRVAPAKGDN